MPARNRHGIMMHRNLNAVVLKHRTCRHQLAPDIGHKLARQVRCRSREPVNHLCLAPWTESGMPLLGRNNIGGKGHAPVNQIKDLIVDGRSAQIGQFIGHRWQWVGNLAARNRI